jgi:hypothetical protein
MLNAEEIKRVELGPRQLLLFDQEDCATAEQERVKACLSAWVQTHGEAEVGDFVQSTAAELTLSPSVVLQHLFWLAHDLEIRFTSAGEAIPPNRARTRLLRSPQMAVQVVLNQSVEATVFQRVKDVFGQMDQDGDGADLRNEVALARHLAGKIRAWKHQLEVCRHTARRPGFPGLTEIDSGLALLRTVSAKLDAPTLIHAFDAHGDALTRLEAEVKTLSSFYAEQAGRWRRLVRFARAAAETLPANPVEVEIANAHERLREIMSHPRPYAFVEEALHLHRQLKPRHDRIVRRQTEQCREAACLKIGALIRKMKTHLNRHAADADTRNRSLYALRQHLRTTEHARTMARIRGQLRAAEEAYEIFREEVAGN